jgi:hypothetical protein
MSIYVETKFPTIFGLSVMNGTITSKDRAHLEGNINYKDENWHFSGHVKHGGIEWSWMERADGATPPSIKSADKFGRVAPKTYYEFMTEEVLTAWQRFIKDRPELIERADLEEVDREIGSLKADIEKMRIQLQVKVDRLQDLTERFLAIRKQYIATFEPQVWVGDEAVATDADGPTTWNCSAYIASGEIRDRYFPDLDKELAASGYALDCCDALQNDPAAPKWIRDWDGPFSIRVEYVPLKPETPNYGDN